MALVFDISQLETMTGGDAALAIEALDIFRSQAESWGRLLNPGDAPDQWADAAHAIKGAARSVGCMALGEACGTAEALGRSGEATLAKAGVAIATIKDALGQAIEAVAQVEHQLMMKKRFAGVRIDLA
jgi:HPt (histidine-containing phosphotransfer) domain-containing protein